MWNVFYVVFQLTLKKHDGGNKKKKKKKKKNSDVFAANYI